MKTKLITSSVIAPVEPLTQFGFCGWNLENVFVKIVNIDNALIARRKLAK